MATTSQRIDPSPDILFSANVLAGLLRSFQRQQGAADQPRANIGPRDPACATARFDSDARLAHRLCSVFSTPAQEIS